MLVILIILVLLYYAVGWCCQVCMGTLNICDWFIAWKHWSYHWEVVHSILKHSRNYHYALHVVNEIGNVAEQIKIYWTTFFGNILACILHVCRSSCNFLGFTYVKLLWPNDYMMDDYMWMQACRQYSGKSYSLAGMLFEWRRCSDAWQIFFINAGIHWLTRHHSCSSTSDDVKMPLTSEECHYLQTFFNWVQDVLSQDEIPSLGITVLMLKTPAPAPSEEDHKAKTQKKQRPRHRWKDHGKIPFTIIYASLCLLEMWC